MLEYILQSMTFLYVLVCFFFYLFVSEALLSRVLCRELAAVFIRHLSLSPQRVITEVSSYYLHFI